VVGGLQNKNNNNDSSVVKLVQSQYFLDQKFKSKCSVLGVNNSLPSRHKIFRSRIIVLRTRIINHHASCVKSAYPV